MTSTDAARPLTRNEIPEHRRWQLADIYADAPAWQAAYEALEQQIEAYGDLAGTLAQGPTALLHALQRDDELGALSHRVWFHASLMHDEDQRDNVVDARRQQVQILLSKAQQAAAWFRPELLALPLETVRGWLAGDPALALYRFALEEVYRQQEHVLDQQGEQLLSLGARFASAPPDAYSALTTADMRFPTITLSSGEEVTVTYGKYRALLATCRVQEDRARAFKALYGCYAQHANTYAALYNAVCQRDLFYAQARRYGSTLEGALHGNDVPVAVVENLLESTRAGAEPLRRYHRLRQRVLGLTDYHLYDGSVPLTDLDLRYPYDDVTGSIIESVALLGADYQAAVRRAFEERWIDVYENEGKRSGAYSAPVYGVHPYMLLNYNDTLDDVFTLAHEMGHSMHTILSHQSQPFTYASYTIFVAEVASTLNEALLLDHLLARTDEPKARALLLQHAIDGICGTFYTQVLFADWELAAHREVEAGKPLTAERLSALYRERLAAYYGDAITVDERYDLTWARIPHFFRSPYYVYQYATCFASSARILADLRAASGETARRSIVARYLDLLRAGSSDHPMTLLARAGADLADPQTVRAVVQELDGLVSRLEQELGRL